MQYKKELISFIKKYSYQYSTKPTFSLSSGKMSRYYFNLKKTTCSAQGQYLIGNLIYQKIIDLGLEINAIGGLTMGADPISIAASYTSFLNKKSDSSPFDAFIIRKEPKGHGMMLQIEGNIYKGNKVIIVDDVITTGSATIKAVKIAREYGLIVIAVIALLDRCEENGRQNVEALDLPVYSILTINDFQ